MSYSSQLLDRNIGEGRDMLGVWFSVVRERERGERKTENWAPSLSGS